MLMRSGIRDSVVRHSNDTRPRFDWYPSEIRKSEVRFKQVKSALLLDCTNHPDQSIPDLAVFQKNRFVSTTCDSYRRFRSQERCGTPSDEVLLKDNRQTSDQQSDQQLS
jgi:hypothetical protein